MVKNNKWLLWWRGVWTVIIDKDFEFRWFISVKKIIINYIKDLYWFTYSIGDINFYMLYSFFMKYYFFFIGLVVSLFLN